MTFDFDRHPSASSESEGTAPQTSDSRTPATPILDTLKRDRFELLSAYLDSEVTATERRQVEEWLATDPTVQRLHARLLTLRQGIQALPTPASQPADRVAATVLGRVGRRQWQTRLVWAGTAAAAVVIGAFTGDFVGGRKLLPQFAQSPAPVTQPDQRTTATKAEPNPNALMIALDRPVVEIPKAPVSAPESSLRPIRDADSTH